MNQSLPISSDILHNALLNAFFWDFVDQGRAPENTPLFNDEATLIRIIVGQFQISEQEAQSAITIARAEVEL